jgi:DNA-binding NarL/FixJ family response regulator
LSAPLPSNPDVTVSEDPSADSPIRVLVVDDQRLVRAGFRVILEAERDMLVVGEASDGAEALQRNRELHPDVVLMDIRMPGMDGLAAARRIVATSPARVLILTTFDADEYVYEALCGGASGFMLKDTQPDLMVAAVRAAYAGNALIDASVTRRLIAQFARAVRPTSDTPAELQQLTRRELDVLRLLTRGLSNTEIAAEMIVEETTVKTHVSRILMKLQLRDRVQAVILAYESGFVHPG